MSTLATDRTVSSRHWGRHLEVLAIAYAVLFNVGLAFTTYVVPPPNYPAPGSPTGAVLAYFHASGTLIRLNTFVSVGAAVVFGVFVAALVRRLRSLGAAGAGPDIVLFAGFLAAFDQVASHLADWVLTWPDIGNGTTLGLYYLSYAFGGPGFSVPMGLFVGAACLVARSTRLLPAWIVWLGIAIAIVGAISSLNLLAPTFSRLPLTIPLTRFPAFAWLIAAAFTLPKRDAPDFGGGVSLDAGARPDSPRVR